VEAAARKSVTHLARLSVNQAASSESFAGPARIAGPATVNPYAAGMLSDGDLMREMKAGRLVIEPFDPDLVQPASIEVTLGRQFRIANPHQYGVVDSTDPPPSLMELVEPIAGLMLHPGEFALGTTVERVEIGPCLSAQVSGKSSLGRLGLIIHCTAGFIDPGFQGQVTLELSNVSTLPILLKPGMRIAQLNIFRMSSPTKRPYGSPGLGSRYQNQVGPTPHRTASQEEQ
jgi:dCTP deaminase